MKTIEERLDALEQRNRRVEADKKWEGSALRRGSILVMTYLIIGIFLTIIEVAHPWVNALVPSIGFLLSTLTVGWLKQIWMSKENK